MNNLNPSFIQAHQYRRQDMLDRAAQYRLIETVHRSGNPIPAKTTNLHLSLPLPSVRTRIASLAAVAFGRRVLSGGQN